MKGSLSVVLRYYRTFCSDCFCFPFIVTPVVDLTKVLVIEATIKVKVKVNVDVCIDNLYSPYNGRKKTE